MRSITLRLVLVFILFLSLISAVRASDTSSCGDWGNPANCSDCDCNNSTNQGGGSRWGCYEVWFGDVNCYNSFHVSLPGFPKGNVACRWNTDYERDCSHWEQTIGPQCVNGSFQEINDSTDQTNLMTWQTCVGAFQPHFTNAYPTYTPTPDPRILGNVTGNSNMSTSVLIAQTVGYGGHVQGGQANPQVGTSFNWAVQTWDPTTRYTLTASNIPNFTVRYTCSVPNNNCPSGNGNVAIVPMNFSPNGGGTATVNWIYSPMATPTPPSYTISGRVLDAGYISPPPSFCPGSYNYPTVRGIPLTLTGNGASQNVISDYNGNFTFNPVPNGNYTACFGTLPSQYTAYCVGGVLNSTCKTITVNNGNNTANDFIMRETQANTPVLSCGTYNPGNNTYAVRATWASGVNGFIIIDDDVPPGSRYSTPWYLNTVATPPVVVSTPAPAGRPIYARLTFNTVNYYAAPILCNPSPTPNLTATPTPGVSYHPIGLHESSACDFAKGWTCDRDNFNIPLDAQLYSDGAIVPGAIISAGGQRDDIAANCGNNPDHGFSIPIPDILKDGNNHTLSVQALGVNSGGLPDGGDTTLTANGSQTINCTVSTPTPTPTTPPQGAWIKMKELSVHANNTIGFIIPKFPVAYDADDPGNSRLIDEGVGSGGSYKAGVVGGPVPFINGTQVSSSQWKETTVRNINHQFSRARYLSYIKSRKSYISLNTWNPASVTKPGIYYYTGATAISLTTVPSFNMVLISDVPVTITGTGLPGNFNVTGNALTRSIAIIAPTINFSSSLSIAGGIFISDVIDTGTANNGLKVIGNLVTYGSFGFNRNKNASGNTAPSLFIVGSPKTYSDLLPYLSTTVYDWQQLQ